MRKISELKRVDPVAYDQVLRLLDRIIENPEMTDEEIQLAAEQILGHPLGKPH